VALSIRHPFDSEIQCAVNAKYAAKFAFDQTSKVKLKLICPEECYQSKLVSRAGRQNTQTHRKVEFQGFEQLLPMADYNFSHLIATRDVSVDESLAKEHT